MLRTWSTKKWLTLLTAMFASSLFAAPEADINKAPDAPTVGVISNKKYRTKNRAEIGVFVYDASVRNDYVQHQYSAHLTVGYHIFDWLALEAYGGYVPAFGRSETVLMQSVRTEAARQGIPITNFGYSNSFYTTWYAGGDIQWAPFYGKLSLVSEVETNFQLYLLVGLGGEGTEVLLPTGTEGATSSRLAINAGAGLRIFLADFVAARFQVQQAIGKSPISQMYTNRMWIQLGLGFFI